MKIDTNGKDFVAFPQKTRVFCHLYLPVNQITANNMLTINAF